jgi:hypothetical protein
MRILSDCLSVIKSRVFTSQDKSAASGIKLKYSPINYSFEDLSDLIEDLTKDQFNKILRSIEEDDALGRIEREHRNEFLDEFEARYSNLFE